MYRFSVVLTFILTLSIAGQAIAAPPFPDALASWFRTSIDSLAHSGVISGYPDGFFRPRHTVNRAEFLKMIMSAVDVEPYPGTSFQCFPDVDAEAWYAPHVCTAAERGIAKGHDDGLFRPEDSVTVIEGLAFTFRALELRTISGDHWYTPYEQGADNLHVLQKSAYRLEDNLMRGRAAHIIKKGLEAKQVSKETDNLSGGCGIRKPALPPSSLKAANKDRSFILSVPSRYTPRKPHGLIIALHGRTNGNSQIRDYMGLEKNQQDFLVAYPAAYQLSNGTYSWTSDDHIEFFDRLIYEVGEKYCIDRDQIFVVGHSLGGWFANKLGCVRGDIIRGIGIVAGTDYDWNCKGPVSALYFHNPDDPLVPYRYGEVARDDKIAQSQCTDQTIDITFDRYSCQYQTGCRTGNPIVWCDYFEGAGGSDHSWPHNAGRVFQTFFKGLGDE